MSLETTSFKVFRVCAVMKTNTAIIRKCFWLPCIAHSHCYQVILTLHVITSNCFAALISENIHFQVYFNDGQFIFLDNHQSDNILLRQNTNKHTPRPFRARKVVGGCRSSSHSASDAGIDHTPAYSLWIPQLSCNTRPCICCMLSSRIKFLDFPSFPGGYSPLCFHSVIANRNLRIFRLNDYS